MTAIFVDKFQPEHPDAEIILEQIVSCEESQVFNDIWDSFNEVDGFDPSKVTEISIRLRQSACNLLCRLTDREHNIYLPF